MINKEDLVKETKYKLMWATEMEAELAKAAVKGGQKDNGGRSPWGMEDGNRNIPSSWEDVLIGDQGHKGVKVQKPLKVISDWFADEKEEEGRQFLHGQHGGGRGGVEEHREEKEEFEEEEREEVEKEVENGRDRKQDDAYDWYRTDSKSLN